MANLANTQTTYSPQCRTCAPARGIPPRRRSPGRDQTFVRKGNREGIQCCKRHLESAGKLKISCWQKPRGPNKQYFAKVTSSLFFQIYIYIYIVNFITYIYFNEYMDPPTRYLRVVQQSGFVVSDGAVRPAGLPATVMATEGDEYG